MNEAETRKEFIDSELKKRGWNLKDKSSVIEEYEMEVLYGDGTRGRIVKSQFADYLLQDEDGQTPLAVVEAKRTSKDPRVGQQQAVGYAENIRKKFGAEPFIFLSNGVSTLFWDRQRYAPRKVYGFFDRKDLKRIQYIRSNFTEDLSSLRPKSQIINRDYQVEAIKRIGNALKSGKRRCLLVMATGTGKTRVAMASIDLLMRAKWINNVLFLTDRRLLRDQAYGPKGFQGFFTESMGKISTADFDQTKRLYSSTIQTMAEIYQSVSPGFFDLIIMDECHRSIYNKWQDVLMYFDAIQIGLTATPSESIDRDTFRFFACDEDGPTFNYSYDEALEDKVLVPFTPYHAKTSFQIDGLKADQIPDEIKDKLIAEGKTEEELSFEGTEFERRFTNTASLEAMVKEFMEVCTKDDSGTLPGKTIYFALSKEHAYRVLEAFERLYPEHKGRLAEVIVSDDRRADDFLKRFEHDPYPRVAISVDMLDTGVDVREAVNLVFAKPVLSKIKFWQMVGRGTRTLDPNEIKPWCSEKKSFLIIDHWSNFEFFNLKPDGDVVQTQVSLPTRLFKLRVEKLKLLSKDKTSPEYCETQAELLQSIRDLPADSIMIRENKAVFERALSESFWKNLDTVYLEKVVAPYMRFTVNVNIDIYSFLIKVEKLALAILKKDDKSQDELGESIRKDIQAIPTSLHVVRRKQEQLLAACSDEFWDGLAIKSIAFLKSEIAPLTKYKDTHREIIKFDLDDKVIERKWIEFGPHGEGQYVEKYRENVEKRIRQLADQDATLQKLKSDTPINDADLESLERVLNSPDLFITEKNLREIYGEPGGTFKQFILQILGKFRFPSREEKIAEHFERFIHTKNYLAADQVRFLRIVKNVFIEKSKRHERIKVTDLYEGPFEVLGSEAADRLFSTEELKEIVQYFNELVQL